MEVNKEILKGHIDTILLSMLAREDLYGYRIAQLVREKSQNQFHLKEATLYVSLKRLEKNKCIASYWSEDSGPGGRRKYYSLTTYGKQTLVDKRSEWNFVKNTIDLLLEESGYEKDR